MGRASDTPLRPVAGEPGSLLSGFLTWLDEEGVDRGMLALVPPLPPVTPLDAPNAPPHRGMLALVPPLPPVTPLDAPNAPPPPPPPLVFEVRRADHPPRIAIGIGIVELLRDLAPGELVSVRRVGL